MLSRRDILHLCGAVTAVGLPFAGAPREAAAAPKDARKLLSELTGGAEQQKGGIRIVLPAVTDQARHVPLRVSVL